MARECSVCIHSDREQIDMALVAGVSNRIIAARFNVGVSAVQRHRAHIPKAMAKAKAVEEVARSGDLLDTTMSLLNEAQEITSESREAGDLRTALDGIGKITNILKLLMAVTLALADRKDQGPDLSQSPEYHQVMKIILEELGPHPDVRSRIATKLQQVTRV